MLLKEYGLSNVQDAEVCGGGLIEDKVELQEGYLLW
jgi:hypothetical protein